MWKQCVAVDVLADVMGNADATIAEVEAAMAAVDALEAQLVVDGKVAEAKKVRKVAEPTANIMAAIRKTAITMSRVLKRIQLRGLFVAVSSWAEQRK